MVFCCVENYLLKYAQLSAMDIANDAVRSFLVNRMGCREFYDGTLYGRKYINISLTYLSVCSKIFYRSLESGQLQEFIR